MAVSYLKSCCDSNITFVLTDLGSPLTLGDVYHVQIPNQFTGCTQVIPSFMLVPGSPSYSQSGAVLNGETSCSTCTATYPCVRITATSECDVLTVVPMTITCSPNLTANTITILVSGGTPPYKIQWQNGFLGATFSGAQNNTPYQVTVTDYSWPGRGSDYTATTTCFLSLPSPTPTLTPTVTPTFIPPAAQTICLQVTSSKGNQNIEFNKTSVLVNGKFTFTSTTSTIEWNSTNNFWSTNIGNNQLLINSNPSSPPLGTWTLNGAVGSGLSYLGSCSTPLMTFKTVQPSNPTCLGSTNGQLFIEVQNSTPPILYSLNGGVTTNTSGISYLFNNLAAGSYSLWAKDANNTIVQQSVTLTNAQSPVNYKLQVNSTVTEINRNKKQMSFVVQVLNDLGAQVSLPVGTTLTFSLVDNLTFSVFGQSASQGNYTQTTQIRKNGNIITPTSSTNQNIFTNPNIGTCPPNQNISQRVTGLTKTYTNITIVGSDVVSGTSVVEIFNISNAACCVKVLEYFNVITPTIAGCTCCSTSTIGLSQQMTITSGTCPI